MPENENVIHADPSKTFFIEMLTRDISLQESILDLVDNSVHNLIRGADLDVMQMLLGRTPSREDIDAKIEISFSPREFRIEDTCGGIPIEDARNEVFRFGQPREEKRRAGLGVYGIGMKRAFFKLGRVISVESRTKNEKFRVDIDVDAWEKRTDWDLEFTYAEEVSGNGKRPGTAITVRNLNPSVSDLLGLVSFQNEVIRRLGATHALFLRTGLKLTVNQNLVVPRIPELLTSGEIKPVRQLMKLEGVDVLILAGVTAREDREPRGWYIFCNGRMVVEADKTELTGWGENKFPQFHSKYNHFLGLVYFRSTDLRRLPWKTTKDGVEKESPVYQRALGQMRVVAKPITDFLTRLYPQDKPIEERPEFEILQAARRISPEDLARSKNTSFLVSTRLPRVEELVRISYQRPLKEVEKVKKAVGNPRMSYREVGQKTFEYFLDKECS